MGLSYNLTSIQSSRLRDLTNEEGVERLDSPLHLLPVLQLASQMANAANAAQRRASPAINGNEDFSSFSPSDSE